MGHTRCVHWTEKATEKIERLTSSIRIQPIESSHETKTLDKGARDGKTHPAHLLIDAPAVDHGPRRQHDKDPQEAAVEPVLGQSEPVAPLLVAEYGAVREVAADDAAEEEADAGGEVEETRVHGLGEVEERVDDVSDRADEDVLVDAE